ncbi:hypothetical protein NEOLEDRAFT_1075772 [Neolentinus lepideus HHB14362 ss-1]|uniref:Uncharacterized protein n=1 Tax=Neolentinus lepideus HHB14362 ss-1 TaxID=1314782 RepID=A0A165P0Z0_9AGAM|nr:hypothetical protein NEOLEDRAFT_1075772 [Neolentinus lepideus HHB14362 ss-1]
MSDPSSSSDQKLSLPAFLKMLTNNGVSARTAMAVAGQIYKTCNTAAALGMLTDMQLKEDGVNAKEDRKLVLAAVRKAGYKTSPAKRTKVVTSTSGATTSTSQNATASPRKRRKLTEEVNEFLPGKPEDELEGVSFGSLDFKEMLDEEVLVEKSTVINRAPIMMAWATVVAERIGFKREEALSIASVYTEMNAITKGVSIGIYKESKKGEVPEPDKGGSQPYVDLMGRSPLYQTASNNWLGMAANKPISPSSAYSYITRALRQTAPYVLGAMRLLAESYEPIELNRKGFGLYCEFRPEVGKWGERGEVKCETILKLRKRTQQAMASEIKIEDSAGGDPSGISTVPESVSGPSIKQEPAEIANVVKEDLEANNAQSKAYKPRDEFEDPDFDDIDFNEVELP